VLAQVPHENYRKVFRAQQRHVERELNPVAASATSLLKTVASSPDGSIDVAEVSSAVDGMIARVEALQRKVCFHALHHEIS
jgi:macrophage erythroblast attacher